MKKLLIVMSVMVGIFAVAFLIYDSNVGKQAEEVEAINTLVDNTSKINGVMRTAEEYEMQEGISHMMIGLESLSEVLQNETILYTFSPNCVYCKAFTPILKAYAETTDINLKMINLDVDTETWEILEIEATPTLIHFKEGKEQDRIVGYLGVEELDAWIKQRITME